jgi:hypothetical protein|tara:strand:+ start:86 stop:310 length:225 start_codon:yes stop_codon:yes gene_type:complete
MEPKSLTDEQLETRLKDATIKLNQASRMNNQNMYQQIIAIQNTLQLEVQERSMRKAKEDDNDDNSQFDDLINVK